jgi:hypothetical protein
MKVHKKQFREDELQEKLLPLLRDNIFHVTSRSAFQKIIKSKYIKSNQTGEFPFTFLQSQISYGRNRGYVCLFDLHFRNEEEIKNAISFFNHISPRKLGNNLAFLILDEIHNNKLISYKTAYSEVEYREMYIPKIECWYPGDLPIGHIKEVIKVSIQRRPPSMWVNIAEKIEQQQ